ncbi:hypothetical protein Q9R19_09935 [Microbacterium sp. ARD32]|uniref:hypothetical protein n=1 Tax=Microbacterium sp. ARD32 TaxID=2962577 RepID=UPI002882B11F|nr:hypothetical protein [Microbacterium sp. ARD32]MDT0157942.1 hypothetical protein [Microbacterium sp. ARD32]
MFQKPLGRILPAAIAVACVALTTILPGCSAATPPPSGSAPPAAAPTPTPTRTGSGSDADEPETILMSPAPADAPPTTFTFADGESMSRDSDIGWGDGFGHDPGWARDESQSSPGRWTYVNTAGTCTAAFRMGRLGDAGDMNDRQASAALVAVSLQEDLRSFDDVAQDGRFFLNQLGNSWVEHSQFTITINDTSYFTAARAFVKADYDVSVFVTCRGEDISSVANEVLSKNVVTIDLE